MRLIDNKEDRIRYKEYISIYVIECNIRDSNWYMRLKSNMDTHQLTTSNYLTYNIYHEIRR
jgi:hypothetical protein